MNVDQPASSRPAAIKAMPALPGSDMSGEPQNNTVMVEQEKFDASLGRYIDRLGKKPFERDIITSHSRVKVDLARLWPITPKTSDDGRQARRLWNMIDDVVQDMPQTTAQIFLRIATSREPLLPTALPVPTEKAVLATFDTKANILVRYDVPPDSDGSITADMGIPSGLMLLCQPLLPVANSFHDTRPVGIGPGAELFNVNEKDKPDTDVRDLVLDPPNTSLPGLRSPNLPAVPPYLHRIDYPHGIYVRNENGGPPILKSVALGLAAEAFFRHEKGILDKKFLAQQRFLQKKSDEENKHLAAIASLTALQQEQKAEDERKKTNSIRISEQPAAPQDIGGAQRAPTQAGALGLSLLAQQEVAAQNELTHTGGQNNGQPQRPESAMVIVPIDHLDMEAPEGSHIFAVGIPKTGGTDTTQTMPIMPGASGPANAIPVNPVRLSVAILNQDTDRVEGEPEGGPEDSNNNAVANMVQASREIVTPENHDETITDQAGRHVILESKDETINDEAGTHIVTSGVERPEIAEAVGVGETSPSQRQESGTNYPASEGARNDAPRNEPAPQETNAPTNAEPQQPDQKPQQANQGSETSDNRQENRSQENQNQGNENRADEQRNDNDSRPGENRDNRQEPQQDNSREELHDEGRDDRQQNSREERSDNQDDGRGRDRQEADSDRPEENHGRDRDDNNTDMNQNSSNPAHDIFDATELFHHHAIGHADIAHGVHSDVRNISMDGGWVTMPSAHGLTAHGIAHGAVPLGNTMLHTHKAALATAPHMSAKGTTVAAVSATPPAQGIANIIKMPTASLGILPFALTHTSASPKGFVTSQRNEQWHKLRKQEALKQNYVASTGVTGAVHPEAHIQHEDLTPDM